MSGIVLENKQRHPKDKSIKDAIAEEKDRFKAEKGLTNKRSTLVKGATENKDLGGTFTPTDEQLERINRFTRRTVTADEVVCFPTLSCNDLVDRDDDQFMQECIKEFASLEEPYSPVGKSFMLDHEYSVKNAVGRIFGVGTKTVNDALFLTNEVYIPRTEKNASLIDDIDFGIAWAVSVGVVLGGTECTVCGERFGSLGWWCIEGHDKGLWYDPNSEETDAWGWPLPVEPESKGAIKCVRLFKDPKDFYELSQVFLGAQYFAELEKDPQIGEVLKAAGGVPLLGLSESEAEKIPMRHEHPKVVEARTKHKIEEDEDGILKWADNEGLIWIYDPEEPEVGVRCLGKTATNKEEEDEDDGVDGLSEGDEDEGGDSSDEPVEDDGGSGDEDQGEGGGSEPQGGSEGSGVSEVDTSDPDDTGKEVKSLSKKDVLAAARKAGLSDSLISAAESGEGNGLIALLSAVESEHSDLTTTCDALKTKAELGEKFIESLRASAIDWYVKAHQEPGKEAKSVSVDTFTRLLDKCGDDVDLIRSLMEEQRDNALEKMPKSVRRSSFPTDPHERPAGGDNKDPDETDVMESGIKLSRIHT